ncbi:hypothetical protein BCR35DRAFT_187160 [Leucosporidium creatinivorum]|uniref:DNA helicase Pif1-like 2B domain-containing protein n=1 Tax=Leucosporidium creatinivorum TaxID=106004 RepID=A0A1Y2DX88_9BASI|nr:hypothetical protein BCR35DRAFT_187160 [Leucosporidium creatinivorum]
MTPGCGLEWRAVTFAFETETWAECNFKVMELTKVFRQRDPEFVTMLEKFRRGHCDEESVALLQGCGTALSNAGSIKPTNLYPLRDAVARENAQEYKKLKDKAYTFEADDAFRGLRGKDQMKTRLNLKKGAQVLLLANLDVKLGLVNGSRGVIVDWVRKGEEPLEHESLAGVRNAAEQSRNRGRGGFGSEEWRETAAADFMDKQLEAYLPVVFFAVGITRVVQPHTWCIDIDRENSVARTQIPLALAWSVILTRARLPLIAIAVLTSLFRM